MKGVKFDKQAQTPDEMQSCGGEAEQTCTEVFGLALAVPAVLALAAPAVLALAVPAVLALTVPAVLALTMPAVLALAVPAVLALAMPAGCADGANVMLVQEVRFEHLNSSSSV